MNKKSILLILLSTLALGANAQGKYTILKSATYRV